MKLIMLQALKLALALARALIRLISLRTLSWQDKAVITHPWPTESH